MEEKVIGLLKNFKDTGYEVLRVTVMGATNSNRHLVIRIKHNGEINVVECPYVNIVDVKAFLVCEFPKTKIIETVEAVSKKRK